MPICGVPILLLWVKKILSHPDARVIVNVAPHTRVVEFFLGALNCKTRINIYRTPKIHGTLQDLKAMWLAYPCDNFFAIHADVYSNLNVSHFIRFSQNFDGLLGGNGRLGIVCGFHSTESASVGRIYAKEQEIINFREKDPSAGPGLANAAIYWFRREIFSLPGADVAEDIAGWLLSNYFPKLALYYKTIEAIDIGCVDSLERAQKVNFSDTEGDISDQEYNAIQILRSCSNEIDLIFERYGARRV